MLQALFLAKEEDIQRSVEIARELERNPKTEKRNELLAELARLTGKVLNKINSEILNDLNNLSPLLRGHLLKTFNESYEVEIEMKDYPQRYGLAVEVINGKKMMYDAHKDKSERKYKPLPRTMAQKVRTIFVVETKRATVEKIKKLIMDFWARCKGEFHHVSIDVILNEKKAVEFAISKTNRNEMKRENFTETEFQDSTYIRRPMRTEKPIPRYQNTDDLFKRYDDMVDRNRK